MLISKPWGVTAYGMANVKAMPDLVRIKFRVVCLEQTPSAAFAAAGDTVRAVRQALRDHGLPDAAVDRSRLDLASAWEGYGSERRFVGYRCQASFSVRSGDLDRVQPLLVDLVAAGANEIDSVDFDVSAMPELRANARREAVKAARRKAELFAEAAEVRLGAVVHIEDVDPSQLERERYKGHGSGGEASGEDFAPGQVVVSAAVVLGFAIARE